MRSMKKVYLTRVAACILACMLLLTGCQSSKFKSQGAEEATTQDDVQTNDAELTIDAEANENTTEGAVENTTENPAGDTSNNPSDTTTDADIDREENPPVKVKALYLTGWTVGGANNREHYIELANTTEINSYVVDIKDDDGFVGYESQIPEVRDSGTWEKKYNADTVLEDFHDNDIYVIGRVVVFKDPLYSVIRPDLAIKTPSGGLWKDKDNVSWLNPYNEEGWEYNVKIAKEAVAKGFDEIQFDYLRFPSDGKKSQNYSGADLEKEKYEAICDFLAYAKEQIPEVPISADVYGIILESPEDREGIGQYLEYIGKDIDYISPMVYPSHYALGQVVNKIAFPKPDLDPYGVVYNSLVRGKERIAQVSDYKAGVRAYLQDFNAPWVGKGNYQEYGAEQVRQQIQAVYDAGYEEWIIWDARNKYHEDAFEKEEKQEKA